MSFFRGLFFVLVIMCLPFAYAVQKGGVQYSIPIEYNRFDEAQLNSEADTLFNRFLSTDNDKQKEVLLDQLLWDYSILGELDKTNPLYFTRLGIIYDKMGKDRWAKSNFNRSTSLSTEYPYAFYAFANYYFDRNELRRALKLYQKAYDTGYNSNYDTLYKMGVIYEKLGDFKSAILFFQRAKAINNSQDLTNRIYKLENLYNNNSLYDSKRGINK